MTSRLIRRLTTRRPTSLDWSNWRSKSASALFGKGSRTARIRSLCSRRWRAGPGRLNWEPPSTIYMVDGGSQFNLPGPARHRREHNDRIRAVRLLFPKSAEADLLRQFDQSRDVGRRVVSRRINLDVIDHTCLFSNS